MSGNHTASQRQPDVSRGSLLWMLRDEAVKFLNDIVAEIDNRPTVDLTAAIQRHVNDLHTITRTGRRLNVVFPTVKQFGSPTKRTKGALEKARNWITSLSVDEKINLGAIRFTCGVSQSTAHAAIHWGLGAGILQLVDDGITRESGRSWGRYYQRTPLDA